MSIRDIPRGAVDSAVKLARLPVDVAISLLPGNGRGARPAASIAVDRWDATVREFAGYALFDEELREEATRRRLAADERARALRLRNAAEARSAAADEKLADRVDQAEQRRAAAEERAERERAEAERRREAKARAAAQAEAKRKADNRRARAKVEEVIDEQADAARLEQLEAEAKALEEREAALIARDEARRLQDAATTRKAARKKT
jgi:flagellar biosynthesis GTPase FlhF